MSFGSKLAKEIVDLEKTICRIAGSDFNINSPRQLGQVLFEVLKICEKPRKTRTGQYATDEQIDNFYKWIAERFGLWPFPKLFLAVKAHAGCRLMDLCVGNCPVTVGS